jgi:cysteine desulfurase / selenocysteine lyase
MHSYKKDFPIFDNNSTLIYLDSASSTQKPRYVIDWIKEFLETSYANIHRGVYSISEQSEDLYTTSKKKFANVCLLKASAEEIIYTYNATYAYNMLAESLFYSGILQKGDSILIDIASHHANIIPWQMLSDRHGINIKRLEINSNYDYDIEHFITQYDDTVKVVSLSAASNVTWTMYDLHSITNKLREDTMFIVDGSQLLPHASIDVVWSRIDALISTGHKIMADTWIGILYLAKKRQKLLKPARWWWWMIEDVNRNSFTTTTWVSKFEPGTPHIVW